MKKKKNGFTLVELLAVIVVLAIIMVIAVPSVLNIMADARRSGFALYVENVVGATQKRYLADSYKSVTGAGVYVYDIKNDLDLQTTGGYNGYVVVNALDVDHIEYSVFMYDKYYQIVNYNTTVAGYPESDSSAIEDFNSTDITTNYNSAVKVCTKVASSNSDWNGQCYNRQGYIITESN